jgi:hypothetical protein
MATPVTQPDPMLQRMLGALRLHRATYEDVEQDKSATGQAAFIVVATSAVAGAVSFAVTGVGSAGDGILGAIGALIGWAAYAWLAYFLGTRLFPAKETKADWGEVARTLGFASTPRFIYIFALVPGLAGLVQLVVGIWVLIATVVALQAALDCSLLRALLIGIAASIVQGIIFAIALSIFV